MTTQSATHPVHETESAIALAKHIGVRHIILQTQEMADPKFTANRTDRCYWCKRMLFTAMRRCARDENVDVLAHGANVDDLADFRPGFAAAQEMGIKAPLIEAGLTKAAIRQLAQELGLPNWDRPAMACLATRIPYGQPLVAEVLDQVARAEKALAQFGVTGCRVRHHGPIARIEVEPAQLTHFLADSWRRQVVDALRAIGYDYVALDLEGYVSGKMNREIQSKPDP
jgi:uncharacterized protein